MKLEYYKETDSLYIDLSPRASTESQEVADGIVIDLDEKGDIVGIDIQHASVKLDLSSVEAVALPARAVKVG
jgi:uncharacterized protein YuzE